MDEAELEDPRRLVLFEPAAHNLHADFPRIIHHQCSLDQVAAMLILEDFFVLLVLLVVVSFFIVIFSSA